MAELFTVRLDLGPEVPIAELTSTASDLRVIHEASLQLATASAAISAQRYVSDLVGREGLQAAISRFRSRELRRQDTSEYDVSDLEQLAHDYDRLLREFWPPPFSRRYRGYTAALATSAWAGGTGSPLETLLQQLVADETSRRLPTRGARVRSFTYANPAATELILDSGAASVAFGYLLTVLVTLGPRRRREVARADTEERIQEANARNAEDRTDRAIELRRIMIDRIARGDLPLTPDQVTDALITDIAGAADRLADRAIGFDRQPIDE
jgi:hypothetical protein